MYSVFELKNLCPNLVVRSKFALVIVFCYFCLYMLVNFLYLTARKVPNNNFMLLNHGKIISMVQYRSVVVGFATG